MGEDTTALGELLDRQRIWECMLRYARGMDRLDRELVLSAYHSDAIEDHGAFIAPAAQFADQVLEFHHRTERVTHHILSNHSCQIDGNTAHTETYTRCFSVMASGPHRLAFGRFVDRLEKRDGRWGIVSRVSLPEGATELAPFDDRADMINDPRTLGFPTRDRSDPSYLRPLPLTRG